MKKFFSIIMVLVMVLSLVACSNSESINTSSEIVYSGEFTITKLEHYSNITSGLSYLLSIKSEERAILFKVYPETYLKYEIGDVLYGDVKRSDNRYYFAFDGNEWMAITTIGFEN